MYVLGTAGHVDHGKSTLIERLTGIDPDRLSEEKARGLTIDLGFAWLTLPRHGEVGIIDVPGHERFVTNMLAGVGSIDATIFVVAANEGWKPQSEEHLAILDLLGARGGVVALTKCDLVGGTELDAAAAAIAGRLAGTTLERAAIVPVSATTGRGIDELITAIDRMLDRTPQSPDLGRPRLYVDRSFSIKGAGTVVTGTLTGGRLRVEDEVEILPRAVSGRVRSIQTHKRHRDDAEAGSRVALNIAGLDRSDIVRGDAVVRPASWRPTKVLDVRLRVVRGVGHAVGPRGAYKLHLGSAEVDARLRLLDATGLTANDESYARITLGEEIVADTFDRFVLRDNGRSETVAGGTVLDAHPARARLTALDVPRRIAELRARHGAGRGGLVAALLEERGPLAAADLVWLAGASPADGPLRGYVSSPAWLAGVTESVTRTLRRFHEDNPLARGMPREDVRNAAGIDDPKLFAALVDALAKTVAVDGRLLRLASHRITLSADQQAARDRLVGELEAAGFSPPPLAELVAAHGANLVAALVDSGEIVKVSPDIAFARDRFEDGKRAIAETIKTEGPATASRIRDVLGTSRKFLIPLLEHLDAAGFTVRDGDVRVLGDGGRVG
jgi:selenocysteine-specific elongation factor